MESAGAVGVFRSYYHNEFVIGFYGKNLEAAEVKFKELVSRMDRKFAFGGEEVNLSISVGVAVIEEEIPYNDLFKTADAVLYSVKEKGKNSYWIERKIRN